MTALRLLRIAAVAVGFWFVFGLSQKATAARHAGETLPGIEWAIAVLTVIFLLGAYASERAQGQESTPRKDLLWGLGVGGLVIVADRLFS